VTTTDDRAVEADRLLCAIRGDALLFGAGRRRTGELYSWILDLRVLLLRSELLDEISRRMWGEIRSAHPDGVLGIGMSGALLVSGVLGTAWRDDGVRLTGAVIRSEPKQHGLAKTIEGDDLTGRRLAFLDDVVNSGGTASAALDLAASRAARVVTAATIVTFGARGHRVLRDRGIRLHALYSTRQLGLAPVAAAPPSALGAPRAVRMRQGPPPRRSRLIAYRDDGASLRLWAASGTAPVTVSTWTVGGDGHALACEYGGAYQVAVQDVVRSLGADGSSPPWPIGPQRPNALSAGPLSTLVVTGGGDGATVHVRPAGMCGRSWTKNFPDVLTVTEWSSARSIVMAGATVVRCADIEDGRPRWDYRAADTVTALGIAGDRCIVVDRSGHVAALTARGVPAWSAHVVGAPRHAVLAADDDVLVLTGDRCVALRADGRRQWVAGAGTTSTQRATSTGTGVVIVASEKHPDRVELFAVRSGRHLATQRLGAEVASVHSWGGTCVARLVTDRFVSLDIDAGPGHHDHRAGRAHG
jgi:orotate phosphoribosyltransferase